MQVLDYYSALTDLEQLDPDGGNVCQPTEETVCTYLFSIDRLDLVEVFLHEDIFSTLLSSKLRQALHLKKLLFNFEGIESSNKIGKLSPRHLAEIELLRWRPSVAKRLPKLLAVERPVRADWRRRHVSHNDPGAVVSFYKRTESYIWELMAANNLVETLYNYGVTLDKMRALGVTEFVDYGAGIGSFIIAARSAGFQALHMDLPSPTLDFAQWRYHLRGLDVPIMMANGNHDDLPSTQAIVCTEVIEHLARPLDLMRAFRKALPIGGVLVVSESCLYTEKFVSHLPSNRWLGGKRFDFELRRLGFDEVLPTPAVHPRVFRRQQ